MRSAGTASWSASSVVATVLVALAVGAGCSRSDPVVVVSSGTAPATASDDAPPPVPTGPSPHTIVFDDEATCAEWTGSDRCGWVMCDHVPAGETFESTCGPWFQEGITSSALDDAAIDRIAEQLVGTCAVVEGDRVDVVHVRLPDGSSMWFGGPEPWRRATAETVVAGCDG